MISCKPFISTCFKNTEFGTKFAYIILVCLDGAKQAKSWENSKQEEKMKQKKVTKKLALNKKTIVNLNDSEKASIYGGYDPTQETMCTHTDFCCTWWYTCNYSA